VLSSVKDPLWGGTMSGLSAADDETAVQAYQAVLAAHADAPDTFETAARNSCMVPASAAAVNASRRGNSCAPLMRPSRRWTSPPGCFMPPTNSPPLERSRAPADPRQLSRSPPKRHE
jgi:hypothetical protein